MMLMLCKVVLINQQNSKYCCMFTFDSTHVIMLEMYHHEYYIMSTQLGITRLH